MNHKMNKRTYPFQVKEVESSGSFIGYGSVFGNIDQHNDIVEAGAFKDTIKEHRAQGTMPSLLRGHSQHQPIGVWKSMEEDDKGLLMEGKLLIDDVQLAKETHALMKAKAMNGLSIGYTVNENGMHFDDEVKAMRITSVKLWEVSVVTFPANELARVGNVKERILAGEPLALRQFEKFLRDEGGFSRSEAEHIALHGFKDFTRREDEDESEKELDKLADELLRIMKGN